MGGRGQGWYILASTSANRNTFWHKHAPGTVIRSWMNHLVHQLICHQLFCIHQLQPSINCNHQLFCTFSCQRFSFKSPEAEFPSLLCYLHLSSSPSAEIQTHKFSMHSSQSMEIAQGNPLALIRSWCEEFNQFLLKCYAAEKSIRVPKVSVLGFVVFVVFLFSLVKGILLIRVVHMSMCLNTKL